MIEMCPNRMARCPVCGNPDLVPLGMTYAVPSRCEAMLVCSDDSCEGSLYMEMTDPSIVATFGGGAYALIRADGGPDGPVLRLEGRGFSTVFRGTGERVAGTSGDPFPEDVLQQAGDEAGRWFARRLPRQEIRTSRMDAHDDDLSEVSKMMEYNGKGGCSRWPHT